MRFPWPLKISQIRSKKGVQRERAQRDHQQCLFGAQNTPCDTGLGPGSLLVIKSIMNHRAETMQFFTAITRAVNGGDPIERVLPLPSRSSRERRKWRGVVGGGLFLRMDGDGELSHYSSSLTRGLSAEPQRCEITEQRSCK